MDQLPRLGKRELICLLLFTCNYVVSVWRGFLFLWVLGMGYVILLWHSLSIPLIILDYFSFDSHFGNHSGRTTQLINGMKLKLKSKTSLPSLNPTWMQITLLLITEFHEKTFTLTRGF